MHWQNRLFLTLKSFVLLDSVLQCCLHTQKKA